MFCVRQLPLRVQGSVRRSFPDGAVSVKFTMLSGRGKRQLLLLIEELDEVLKDQAGPLTGDTPSTPSVRIP
jgi:hypothetical protein